MEMRRGVFIGRRKETISKRYDHWDYHEHKEARKWKNSLLYASATARVIYHGNT